MPAEKEPMPAAMIADNAVLISDVIVETKYRILAIKSSSQVS